MSVAKLNETAIEEALQTLPDWAIQQGKLARQWVFSDFIEAWGFMNQVALLAETANHHPEWSNVYNRVNIELTTHDAGGISEKDFALAHKIDSLLCKRA